MFSNSAFDPDDEEDDNVPSTSAAARARLALLEQKRNMEISLRNALLVFGEKDLNMDIIEDCIKNIKIMNKNKLRIVKRNLNSVVQIASQLLGSDMLTFKERCLPCNKTFYSRAELRKHARLEDFRRKLKRCHKCSKCARPFKTISTLRKHVVKCSAGAKRRDPNISLTEKATEQEVEYWNGRETTESTSSSDSEEETTVMESSTDDTGQDSVEIEKPNVSVPEIHLNENEGETVDLDIISNVLSPLDAKIFLNKLYDRYELQQMVAQNSGPPVSNGDRNVEGNSIHDYAYPDSLRDFMKNLQHRDVE